MHLDVSDTSGTESIIQGTLNCVFDEFSHPGTVHLSNDYILKNIFFKLWKQIEKRDIIIIKISIITYYYYSSSFLKKFFKKFLKIKKSKENFINLI